MIIGGGEIYAQARPYANRIYLTRIHANPEGDTWFPEPSNEWTETEQHALPTHEKDTASATFHILTRKPPAGPTSNHDH